MIWWCIHLFCWSLYILKYWMDGQMSGNKGNIYKDTLYWTCVALYAGGDASFCNACNTTVRNASSKIRNMQVTWECAYLFRVLGCVCSCDVALVYFAPVRYDCMPLSKPVWNIFFILLFRSWFIDCMCAVCSSNHSNTNKLSIAETDYRRHFRSDGKLLTLSSSCRHENA